ncbi:SAM-dependent methyltransferase [Rhodococcus sp. WMMA185]|uniref:SAM-dependent methyltransferase n=1 Tax=Rhodococcus sp. WMMA185 TaxID=679318 RepID=UPI000878C545|nr:class I SAM-dependent methyltransferase [Rhodococcus sp. WMMA185]AOW95271.1 SAM-dependent methyltransferase [Rhodococcus sp. WMMA185]
MARTDDDTWDIATTMGATAVMTAMARADETNSANPLIRDQFAEPLVATPQLAHVCEQVSSMWADAGEADRQQVVDHLAVRTHFFDAFFTEAAEAGIGQHVILASGLDSRPYRLNWPAGTVVYDNDVPAVLEYKAATLRAYGAEPTATLREVGVDLRHDWPAALLQAGFDPTRATAWLAEGLLPFLRGTAQEAMFANMHRLSADGSRVAVEVLHIDDQRRREVEQQWHKERLAREQRGEDVSFDHPFRLWYGDEGRPDCVQWFDLHGWTAQSVDSRQEAQRLGRTIAPPSSDQPFFGSFNTSFVTAELPANP